MRLRRIACFDHGWTKLTILRHWNSLLGRANASGTRRLARSAPRSPMVGSVNAPEPGFRPGVRWGVVPRCCSPIGRPIGSPPFDTRITRPWSRARQFPISRSERRASSAATPPGPREAGAHGYPGTPNRRPLGAWPNCRPCAECSPPKFIGGLYQTAMGVTLALVPCSRYGVSASLWCRASRFWAVFPPRRRGSRRPVLAQTAAIPLSDADPPVLGCLAGKRA